MPNISDYLVFYILISKEHAPAIKEFADRVELRVNTLHEGQTAPGPPSLHGKTDVNYYLLTGLLSPYK